MALSYEQYLLGTCVHGKI